MKDLKHPFIIKPQELIKNKAYFKKSGQILYKSSLVFDLDYHGNLFDYISDSGPFSEKLSRTCFHQMIDVMEYLEMKGIAHCDIKTEILFFDQDFTPFGSAIINDSYYKPLYQKNYDLFRKYHKY